MEDVLSLLVLCSLLATQYPSQNQRFSFVSLLHHLLSSFLKVILKIVLVFLLFKLLLQGCPFGQCNQLTVWTVRINVPKSLALKAPSIAHGVRIGSILRGLEMRIEIPLLKGWFQVKGSGF